MNETQLREAIAALGPWAVDVEVTPGVTTAGSGSAAAIAPRDNFIGKLTQIFPDGLAGRSFLDVGTDCGAYAFFAKEAGAGRVYGFDSDARAIDQAWFLQEHRTVGPTDDMTFAAHDVDDLPNRDLGEFDVTRFSKVFHKLQDPLAGLRLAADRTRELMIVNTSTRTHADGQEMPDGYLRLLTPGGASGGRQLAWYPTGPNVIRRLLEWCGFPETRILWLRKDDDRGVGQLGVCGARSAELLASFDEARAAGRAAVAAGSGRKRR
jgi:tRNA (mo5U34)-methyltransferase